MNSSFMKRDVFNSEHELFRDTVRRFLANEVAPHIERWEALGGFERELFTKAGAQGLLCPTVPEAYGGPAADLLHFGSERLKQTWLPRMVSGEAVGALAMTEPGGGSDVKAVTTRAVREGDHYVLSGAKTFISNACVCDLVIVVAKTDPAAGAKGVSMLVVDTTLPGVTKGQPLKKIGLKSQDTGELVFEEVRVPADHLLGEENKGFVYLMRELPWERLQIAVSAIAASEAAYRWTRDHVRERRAFGQAGADFQHTRFVLAELKTEIL